MAARDRVARAAHIKNMIAHMDWIGLDQNFRKKYGLDWVRN